MQNKTFLYREIYQAIREQIASGELGPEDKLPTEDELARRYSVSKITVKKALEMLKDECFVEQAPKTDGRVHFCLIGPPRAKKGGGRPQIAVGSAGTPPAGGIQISIGGAPRPPQA